MYFFSTIMGLALIAGCDVQHDQAPSHHGIQEQAAEEFEEPMYAMGTLAFAGEPISGAQVMLLTDDEQMLFSGFGVSDPDGNFNFEIDGPGTYRVYVNLITEEGVFMIDERKPFVVKASQLVEDIGTVELDFFVGDAMAERPEQGELPVGALSSLPAMAGWGWKCFKIGCSIISSCYGDNTFEWSECGFNYCLGGMAAYFPTGYCN